MQTFVRTKVTQGGRIVIPADMRRELGIVIGDDVNVTLEDGSVNISTSRSALERLRALAQTVKEDVSVVDELIADRRRESGNE